MPGSMPEGKRFIKNFFLEKVPTWKTNPMWRVLDVGPGSGNYFDLFLSEGEYAGWGPPITGIEWVAVEIWKPYLELFSLDRKYDTIHFIDIYEADWEKLGKFDIVILGDVIEHMSFERAQEVIWMAFKHSRWVVLSLPIVDFPQGASYGNEHEAHVEQYSPERVRELLKDYSIIDQQEGSVIGVYIF